MGYRAWLLLGANPNLHNLPIYQEVEKDSGNVILDSSSVVYLESIAIPAYLGQVLIVKCGSWTPEIEGATPST